MSNKKILRGAIDGNRQACIWKGITLSTFSNLLNILINYFIIIELISTNEMGWMSLFSSWMKEM